MSTFIQNILRIVFRQASSELNTTCENPEKNTYQEQVNNQLHYSTEPSNMIEAIVGRTVPVQIVIKENKMKKEKFFLLFGTN